MFRTRTLILPGCAAAPRRAPDWAATGDTGQGVKVLSRLDLKPPPRLTIQEQRGTVCRWRPSPGLLKELPSPLQTLLPIMVAGPSLSSHPRRVGSGSAWMGLESEPSGKARHSPLHPGEDNRLLPAHTTECSPAPSATISPAGGPGRRALGPTTSIQPGHATPRCQRTPMKGTSVPRALSDAVWHCQHRD